MDQIYPVYEEADIVVLASPMYYRQLGVVFDHPITETKRKCHVDGGRRRYQRTSGFG